MSRILCLAIFSFAVLNSSAGESVGNRFAYLDENNPYYPDGDFPKLITPMWVGEEGVDAVICLTIDDMCRAFPEGKRPKGLPAYARRPRVYYDFLKPVLDRLQEIDGRAPITAFCLQLDAEDKLVRHMQELGMSMECHTWTHPVPMMRTVGEIPPPSPASLQAAIDDTLLCLANLSKLSGPRPVAQRNPGCDARNTASPRMFAEIFPMKTAKGDFLRMDSSIFTAFTKPQPGMPGEWFSHKDGRQRFLKFVNGIPYTKTFRNYVADYPYPFVINRTIWELPAVMPGDAHGVHAYGKQSDETVEDWKRAIDIVVAMKGVYTLCFHPHGYIESGQLVDLVDYADSTYGKRVKFLNLREVYDRLTNNLCEGAPLRKADGEDNRVRLADVNADGFLDVLPGGGKTRVWNTVSGKFDEFAFPIQDFSPNARLFTAAPDGRAGLAVSGKEGMNVWSFNGENWSPVRIDFPEPVDDSKFRFRDVNNDGISDLFVEKGIYLSTIGPQEALFQKAGFSLPKSALLFNAGGKDAGLRFIDLDADGDDDLIFSNDREYGIWRFRGIKTGWEPIRQGTVFDDDAIPSIVEHGRNNGVWFHSGEMIQVNEFTAGEKDHIRHIGYEELLKPNP